MGGARTGKTERFHSQHSMCDYRNSLVELDLKCLKSKGKKKTITRVRYIGSFYLHVYLLFVYLSSYLPYFYLFIQNTIPARFLFKGMC